MKKILFISLLLSVVGFGVVQAQQPKVVTGNKEGWQKIGKANVDFKTEKDEFIIIGADRFKYLKVKVTDAPLHMESMVIHYEGGGTEEVSLRNDFKAGGESKVIDLKNASSELKKVVFVYRTATDSKSEKAELELWGKK